MSCVVSYIDKGLRHSAFFLAVLAALSLLSILIVIVVSVVLRKFFDTPLYFTEELVGLLMSTSLFLALPMVTLNNQHIRVTLLLDSLKSRFPLLLKLVLALGSMVGIGFTGWIFLEAIPWMDFAIYRELKSETARILLYPFMLVVPVSIGLSGLIYCVKLVGLTTLEER